MCVCIDTHVGPHVPKQAGKRQAFRGGRGAGDGHPEGEMEMSARKKRILCNIVLRYILFYYIVFYCFMFYYIASYYII